MNNDDTPRSPLPEPEPEELARAEAELYANPIELWKKRQQWLKDLGCDPGQVDGVPGAKTYAAVKAFQKSAGLEPDGKWGPKTQAAVEVGLALKHEEPKLSSGYVDMLGAVELDDGFWASFVDLTDKSDKTLRKGVRKWPALKRIVWHQTAFTWEPYRERVKAKKFTNHPKINAHACFDTDGSILLLHPLNTYLYTANAFNKDCLSFEIMGNFEGLLGSGNWYKPEKFGRSRPKRVQLIRARQMTKWLLDPSQGPATLPPSLQEWRDASVKLGRPPTQWVNPHRGGAPDRDIDCGSECWYHVAEHTFATYGNVTEGPVAGRGKPTPMQWKAVPEIDPLP